MTPENKSNNKSQKYQNKFKLIKQSNKEAITRNKSKRMPII